MRQNIEESSIQVDQVDAQTILQLGSVQQQLVTLATLFKQLQQSSSLEMTFAKEQLHEAEKMSVVNQEKTRQDSSQQHQQRIRQQFQLHELEQNISGLKSELSEEKSKFQKLLLEKMKNDSAEVQVSQLQQELAYFKESVASLQNDLFAAQEEGRQLQAECQQLHEEGQQFQEEIRQLHEESQQSQEEIGQLRLQNENLAAKMQQMVHREILSLFFNNIFRSKKNL